MSTKEFNAQRKLESTVHSEKGALVNSSLAHLTIYSVNILNHMTDI